MAKKTLKKTPIMTDRQYVNIDGQLCPVCRKGGGLDGSSIEVDSGFANQEVVCNICCAAWTDHYKLVGFTLDSNNTEENDENYNSKPRG